MEEFYRMTYFLARRIAAILPDTTVYAKTAYGSNLVQSVGLSCANLRRTFKIDLCDLSTGLLDVLVYGHAMGCSYPVSLSNSFVTCDLFSDQPSLKYEIFLLIHIS